MNWRKNKFVKKILKDVKKYQISVILALVGLALIGAGLSVSKFVSGSGQPQFVRDGSGGETSNEIKVDVEGAVNHPGVYTIPASARVTEALTQAGNLSGNADKNWVTQNLNLAGKLSDGQKIYIPKVGESVSGVSTQADGKINVNTASSEQLDTLPGIGPVTAQKIIAGRPYTLAEDLLNKKVVGESTFEKIKDKIAVY